MIVLEPWLFRGFFRYDRDIGFRVRSHSFGTNRFGFSDRDYPLERRPGTFRILVLGDSFAWVGGPEGNYTARLEGLLAGRFGADRVEVINAGYPMTHTGEQPVILQKFGLLYRPDLVLLAFFAGNDFYDADPNRKRIVVNDTYFDIDRREERVVLGYPIVARSRLLAFARQKAKVAREAVAVRVERLRGPTDRGEGTTAGGPPGAAPAEPEKQASWSRESYLAIERQRLEICDLGLHASGAWDERVGYVLGAIDDMAGLLRGRGIDFAVAILPDEFQIDRRLRANIFQRYLLKHRDFDLWMPQKILRGHLERRGIPWIDLAPRFRAAGREGRLYKLRDSHWNEAGIALAAEVLAERLTPTVEEALAGGI